MKNVVILNFSGRINGNCASISNYIKDYHKNTNNYVYNISDLISPCGNCDYECLKVSELCPDLGPIKAIMDCIMTSDLVYYIVPNFCGFPCANYFAFNERTVGYFNLDHELAERYMGISKKFIVVSNTEDIAFWKAMQQQAIDPQIIYMKTSKYSKCSVAGDMLASEIAQRDLLAFLI